MLEFSKWLVIESINNLEFFMLDILQTTIQQLFYFILLLLYEVQF